MNPSKTNYPLRIIFIHQVVASFVGNLLLKIGVFVQQKQGINNMHVKKLGVQISVRLSATALQLNGCAEYVIQFILLVKLQAIAVEIEFNLWFFPSNVNIPRWVFPKSTYATMFGVLSIQINIKRSFITFFQFTLMSIGSFFIHISLCIEFNILTNILTN